MNCHRDKDRVCTEDCTMWDSFNRYCKDVKLKDIYIGWALGDMDDIEEEADYA
jgi:hypothetical protein